MGAVGDDLCPARSERPIAARACHAWLQGSDAGSGAGGSRRPRRTRPAGGGADGHRQDCGICLAAAATAGGRRAAGRRKLRARAGAGANPRTGRAGLRQHPRLWPAPAAAHLRGLRRSRHRSAEGAVAQGHGCRGRDARAPARPASPERAETRSGPHAGARRGRPHARPRLFPGTRRHLRRPAAAPADPAVLGDLRRRHPGDGRRHPERSGQRRGQPAQRGPAARPAVGDPR
jgi:hypothetical protein